MGYQFISVKCPECGADFPLEEGRTMAFCSYCGSKLLVSNENEHIYHTIDEAGIKQAETDRMVKLKMLEMEEKYNNGRKALVILWLSATAILFAVGMIGEHFGNDSLGMCVLWGMNVALWGGIALFASKKKRKSIVGSSEAVITAAMENYQGKHINSIMSLLQGAGFTNVTAIPLNDLSFFTQGRNGQVESVSFNGSSDFEEGDVYPKNASVQITYHSR